MDLATQSEHIELTIRGMTCDDCARHVSEALLGVPGVEAVEVPGWQSGRAVVVARPEVDSQRLADAVTRAGYHGRVAARRPTSATASSSEAGGAVAAENALEDSGRVLDLSAMPAVIFTDPQVATVGLTEAAAWAQGRSVRGRLW